MEKRIRSLLKTLSWRITATSTTIILVFLFTGDMILGVEIGSIETLVKIVIYYLHERGWNMSNFGREQSTTNLPEKIPSRKNSSSTPDKSDSKPKEQ